MSYTFKKVDWESCNTNNSSIVNTYGDIVRNESVKIIARKQPHNHVFKTSNGREFLAKSIFYVDPRVEKNAFSIKRMDKLDGETIEDVYEMCGLNNKVRLIRFITV